MPDVYSVILEYKETQEAELTSRITIIDTIIEGGIGITGVHLCSWGSPNLPKHSNQLRSLDRGSR